VKSGGYLQIVRNLTALIWLIVLDMDYALVLSCVSVMVFTSVALGSLNTNIEQWTGNDCSIEVPVSIESELGITAEGTVCSSLEII
jgi:hypothetical protein